jgi:hypothetical protein
MKDFVKRNRHCFTFGVAHNPMIRIVFDDIGRVHPVEWLVCATIGMNCYTTIGFHHDKSERFRKSGLKSTGIFHCAARNDESHLTILADATTSRGGRACVSE